MQLRPGDVDAATIGDVAVLWVAGSAMAEEPARSTITGILATRAPATAHGPRPRLPSGAVAERGGGVDGHRRGDRLGHRGDRQPHRSAASPSAPTIPTRRPTPCSLEASASPSSSSAATESSSPPRASEPSCRRSRSRWCAGSAPATPSVVRSSTVCSRVGSLLESSSTPMPPGRSSPGGCCAPMPCPPTTRSSRRCSAAGIRRERASTTPTTPPSPTMRVDAPERIAKALADRPRRQRLTADGALFIVAADHTARGMIGVPGQPRAMVDRRTMLERLLVALDNPRVDGVLGSADILEDLVCLGALDGKVAVGTMNRGGLAGARWEIDDRFTAYDAEHLVAANLDAGKMLLRIDPDDRGTVPTLAACAAAVVALNDRRMMAMVEPIPYTKDDSGRAVWDHDPDALAQGGRCLRRARWFVGVHLAEDPGDGRHRHRRRGDDPATAHPRRVTGPRSRGHVGDVGAGARAADRARPRRRPGTAVPTGWRRRGRRRAGCRTGVEGRGEPGYSMTNNTASGRHPWHLGAVAEVTPETAGWTLLRLAHPPDRSGRGVRPRHRRLRDGRAAAVRWVRHGRRRGTALRARRAGDGVRRRHRLGLPADRRRGTALQRQRRRGRVAVGSGDAAIRPGARRCRRRRRGDPRRRSGHPAGHQLHVARSVRRCRQADVCGAADPRRQLVELSAAPPRRQPGVPGQQRGDLLLPHRPCRHHRLCA